MRAPAPASRRALHTRAALWPGPSTAIHPDAPCAPPSFIPAPARPQTSCSLPRKTLSISLCPALPSTCVAPVSWSVPISGRRRPRKYEYVTRASVASLAPVCSATVPGTRCLHDAFSLFQALSRSNSRQQSFPAETVGLVIMSLSSR